MQEPLAAEDVNGMGEGAPVVELTEEQLAEIARREAEVEAERQAMLDALGVTLAGNRSKAIMFRESSGIEQEWLEDEEHYEGIDDMNRWERRAWKGKPPEAPSPTTTSWSPALVIPRSHRATGNVASCSTSVRADAIATASTRTRP